MSIQVKQLPNSQPLYLVLTCIRCHNDGSANRGDYCFADPNETLMCPDCKEEMMIAARRVQYDFEEGRTWLQG